MNVKIFCHTVRSDWNHGNAHFLRGVATELEARGHQVHVFEPDDAWSVKNLIEDRGPQSVEEYRTAYPALEPIVYLRRHLDLEDALSDADLVLVHEWNDLDLVRQIGLHRALRGDYILLFHDSHHRAVTDPGSMAAYDLSNYDGVLAFGESLRRCYLGNGWAKRVWTWHEAADTRIFHPISASAKEGEVVWIGNWGDGERTEELREFLLEPVKDLGLEATIFGVRYPPEALAELEEAGVAFGGSLPNFRVPEVFSRFRAAVHIPRRPYAVALPGIPTIRVFEALACGIPLVSAPWEDTEGLFQPGCDFAVARNGVEMRLALTRILSDPDYAKRLSAHGLATIRERHTCAHRVNELLEIVSELRACKQPQVSLR